jgi:hypothetical protein
MHRCVCARMSECVCPQDRTHTRVGVVYVSVHALYASVSERACPDPTRDEWAQAAHNSCKSRQLPIDSGSALMFVSESQLSHPIKQMWTRARVHLHTRTHACTHIRRRNHALACTPTCKRTKTKGCACATSVCVCTRALFCACVRACVPVQGSTSACACERARACV